MSMGGRWCSKQMASREKKMQSFLYQSRFHDHKKGKRDKYGHVTMIKETIYQEDITFINI